MRLVLLSVVLLGCSSHDPDPPPPSSPPPAEPRRGGFGDAGGVATDAAPADAAPPPVDAAPEPLKKGLAVSIDGQTKIVAYGNAFSTSDGMYIALYSEPVPCEARQINDAPVSLSVTFPVPAGPGGTYFAGREITRDLYIEPHREIQVPREYALASGVNAIQWSDMIAGTVALGKVPRKKGSKIRGTIDATEGALFGVFDLHGPFEVDLCDDLDGEGALPASVPSSPLRGRHGKAAVVPRTIHAIVGRRAATRSETTAYKDRTLLDIDKLVLYDKPNVPCPPPGSEIVPGENRIAEVWPLSGTFQEHPLFGVQGPATFVFYKPGGGDGDFDGIWPGWISIDKPLSFTEGDRFHARLYARASDWDDKKGSMGGRVDALVCAPR